MWHRWWMMIIEHLFSLLFVCVYPAKPIHIHTLPPSFFFFWRCCCCNWAQVRLVGKPISLPRAFLTFWEHHSLHTHICLIFIFIFHSQTTATRRIILSLSLSLAHSNLHQRDLLYLYFMRVLVCVCVSTNGIGNWTWSFDLFFLTHSPQHLGENRETNIVSNF